MCEQCFVKPRHYADPTYSAGRAELAVRASSPVAISPPICNHLGSFLFCESHSQAGSTISTHGKLSYYSYQHFSGPRKLSLSTHTLRWCLRSRTRPSTITSPSSSTPLATPPTGGHSPHSETQYLTTTVLKMNKYLYGHFSFFLPGAL